MAGAGTGGWVAWSSLRRLRGDVGRRRQPKGAAGAEPLVRRFSLLLTEAEFEAFATELRLARSPEERFAVATDWDRNLSFAVTQPLAGARAWVRVCLGFGTFGAVAELLSAPRWVAASGGVAIGAAGELAPEGAAEPRNLALALGWVLAAFLSGVLASTFVATAYRRGMGAVRQWQQGWSQALDRLIPLLDAEAGPFWGPSRSSDLIEATHQGLQDPAMGSPSYELATSTDQRDRGSRSPGEQEWLVR